ncbi:YjjG family noncanonical pyrimidine nucleotidase [Spirochaeta cellobiosiphila]|uniref:YjjG family noncanonical pyrimidine nucleotidase n=1 Tax=Spirochaeta cellobiosiphila TaxID=504483 RepID=UPI000424B5B6|nr:YjjG family noncanonical pyrimidine nucleotidase [Spirochaeta cellobiosiphila]
MKYNTVLFDVDNTLFDFTAAELEALSKLLQHYGAEANEENIAVYHRINNKLWKDLEDKKTTAKDLKLRRFELCFDELNIHTSDTIDRISQQYIEYLGQGRQLMPYAEELCRTLYENQIEIIIATNGLTQVQYSRLEGSPIKDFIKTIIISEEIGYAKPELAYFEYALGKSTTKHPGECLMVGDKLSADILGGLRAGMDTCWYNPEGVPNESDIKPHYEVKDLRDILKICL